MIIAGASAFTFKKYLNNVPIGSSSVCEELAGFVKEIEVLNTYRHKGIYSFNIYRI